MLRIDHAAHVAHALGAFGLALRMTENVRRTRGALVDRRAHVPFADAVTIANVQERQTPTDLRANMYHMRTPLQLICN